MQPVFHFRFPRNTYNEIHFMFFLFFFFVSHFYLHFFSFVTLSFPFDFFNLDQCKFPDMIRRQLIRFIFLSFPSKREREREKRNLKEKKYIYIERILAPVKTSHDFKLNLSFFGTSYSSKWFPRRENFDNFARRDSAKNKREGGKRGGGRRKKEWAEWAPWQRLISTGNGSIASTYREEWVRVTFQ